jgi:hypothetical protein
MPGHVFRTVGDLLLLLMMMMMMYGCGQISCLLLFTRGDERIIRTPACPV